MGRPGKGSAPGVCHRDAYAGYAGYGRVCVRRPRVPSRRQAGPTTRSVWPRALITCTCATPFSATERLAATQARGGKGAGAAAIKFGVRCCRARIRWGFCRAAACTPPPSLPPSYHHNHQMQALALTERRTPQEARNILVGRRAGGRRAADREDRGSGGACPQLLLPQFSVYCLGQSIV